MIQRLRYISMENKNLLYLPSNHQRGKASLQDYKKRETYKSIKNVLLV